MNDVAILGAAQISNCGAGMAALDAGLLGSVPSPEWVPITASGEETTAPVLRARPEGLYDVVPPRSVRRLDDHARNFIYAARLAVNDCDVEMPEPERIGVITGTAFGSMVTSLALLDDVVRHGDDAGSPFKFTTSVNNATATSVSTSLDARGPCLTVLGFRDILHDVVRVADAWLEQNRVDVVIVGVGDEYHPLVGYGLNQLGGWAADGRMRPLDFSSHSFVSGETYAVMALARGTESITKRGRIIDLQRYRDLARDYRPSTTMLQLVAADGRSEAAATYASLTEGGTTIAGYSSLWGGNPSAEGLSPLVGSLILQRGYAYPLPDGCGAVSGGGFAEPDNKLQEPNVACVTANIDGSGSVITIHREAD